MKIFGSIYGEIEPPRVRTNAEGWDEMIETECVASQFNGTIGEHRSDGRIGGNFYLQGKSCVGFRGCAPIMEYRSLGIQAAKGYTVEGTGIAERLTGTASGVPGAPFGTWPVSVAVNRVGVIIRYATTGKPNCSVVGTRVEPPEHFGVSRYPFNNVADPSYSVPYWWVLDRRAPKQLTNANMWLVEDEYSYYFLENYNGH